MRRLTAAERVELAARASALAAWRTHAWVQAESEFGVVQSAGDAVAAALGKLHLDRRRADSQITSLWPSVVDARTAAHCKPVGLVRGTLFVGVDSSAWLSEIVRYQRKEILERVQRVMGKETVKKISFRVE